jgi:hypothetical protein
MNPTNLGSRHNSLPDQINDQKLSGSKDINYVTDTNTEKPTSAPKTKKKIITKKIYLKDMQTIHNSVQ